MPVVIPELLDAKQVSQMVHLDVRSIYRLMDAGQFPKPIRVGQRRGRLAGPRHRNPHRQGHERQDRLERQPRRSRAPARAAPVIFV